MDFTASRWCISTVANEALKADLDAAVSRIEAAADDKQHAGARVHALITIALQLERSLPPETRHELLTAVFADAERGQLPHQVERNPNATCTRDRGCQPKDGWICFRDTWTNACWSYPTP